VDNSALAEQALVPASKPLTVGDVDARRMRSLTGSLHDQLALTEMYRDHVAQLQAENNQLRDALMRAMQEKAAETSRGNKLYAELAVARRMLNDTSSGPMIQPASTEGGAA
jgi:hypothetical protein